VSSVRQALILLGTVAVRRWAMLLSLSGLTDRPQQLLTAGLVRARLCELLADAHSLAAADRAFTVGLFSVVDALLGKSMQALLDELPFDSRMRHALLDHDGRKAACWPPCSPTNAVTSTMCRGSASAFPPWPAPTARRSTGPTASRSSSPPADQPRTSSNIR
jgi:hypothetical protein